jgi:hypothetical protein
VAKESGEPIDLQRSRTVAFGHRVQKEDKRSVRPLRRPAILREIAAGGFIF